MCVIFVCSHNWGKMYFGYGKNGLLYCWGTDSAGQFGLARCTTKYLDYHRILAL